VTAWFSRRGSVGVGLEVLAPALPWLILFLSKQGSRGNSSRRGPNRLKEK
jgi:hypothetical protein